VLERFKIRVIPETQEIKKLSALKYDKWCNESWMKSIQICFSYFDVLLTVHLSIILAINQLNAQNLLL